MALLTLLFSIYRWSRLKQYCHKQSIFIMFGAILTQLVPCVCEDESSVSTELAGPQVCPDLGSRGPRGPKLEVYECDTTTTHTICRDCMLHKPQSLSLHAKLVWNPVKLQGFIDSQRHIWKKREAMYKAKFYPVSQTTAKPLEQMDGCPVVVSVCGCK